MNNIKRIINLTPHELSVIDAQGNIIKLPKAEKPLRVEQKNAPIGEALGISIFKLVDGDITPPPVEEGTIYVVTQMCYDAIMKICPTRTDIFFTGVAKRDPETGQVQGCEGISCK